MLTNWNGAIPDGTVWATGQVQVITGDVDVPAGSTLTIQPGAIIKMNTYFRNFIVDGTVLAQGTQASPIIFTEIRDDVGGDTNGDGTNSSPSNGQWGVLQFNADSTGSVLNHVDLRYGGHNGQGDVFVNGGQLTLTNSTIENSGSSGIRIQTSNPTLTGNIYQNNQGPALSMDLASNPAISGVTVTNNYVNGLALDSGTLVGNGFWNDPDVVYWLPDDVTVPQGSTLTISAGQIIKRPYYGDLFVNGSLIATGTAAAPVIFTEARDDTAGGDTNNDQSNSGPGRGQTGVILFSNTSTGNLMDHVEDRYSGHEAEAILDDGAPLTFTNGVIRDSANYGLRIQSSNPTVTGNSFTNDASGAISMDLASNPLISGNTVTGNGVNGVVLDTGTLAVNLTWNNPDIVYWFSDDITVPVGLTLTISAGQIIKRPYYGDLFVNGSLIATGTAAAPVIFTEQRDDTAGGDTNNDQSNSGPDRGQTGVILFSNTSTGNLMDHVEDRYSGHEAEAILDDGAPLTFTNGVIRDSANYGLRIQSSNPTVTGNAFTNDASGAISMDLASNPHISGNTVTGNGVNGVVLDTGTLAVNLTWNNPDIVYWFSDDITVPVGVTLTIAPGQVIKRPYYADLLVNGSLTATGTVSAPIVFTERRDDTAGGDTNNDGVNSGPSNGQSGVILFSNTSTANLMDHVEVRYAGYGYAAAVVVDGGSLTFTDDVIRNSSDDALQAKDSGTLNVQNSLLVSNSDTGIRAESGATVTAVNNTIDGNYRGVSVDGLGTLVTLTNNIITNNSYSGIDDNNRGSVTAQFNDVLNPGSSYGDYKGLSSATGQSGNLSVDPQYVNRVALDYHLQATSPVIDAATSGGAPIDDLDFNFRVDDPAVPNTGAGASPFYDMGAYELGGTPRALKSFPTGDVSNVVSQIVFTFRGAMDTTSFSPAADVVSFTGPSGPIAVTGFLWLDKYQLQVNFSTQVVVGLYQLVLGPNILDANGHALDTNANGTPGEPIDDRYTASWTIVPPKILSASPNDYTPPPLDHINFTFDRPMDPTSFDLSDIVSFTGPNGNLTATGFNWVDPRTLQISFDSQSALGAYDMVLGPNIADLRGNLLDQNGNDIGGEANVDNYSAAFTLANIFHISGNITQDTTLGGLVIVDNNVTVQSGVTLTFAPGTVVKFDDTTSINVQAGAVLNASGTLAQPIHFTSIHDDTLDGDTEHNGDRFGPGIGDWDGILIEGGTATIDHAVFNYGGGTVSGSWDNITGGTITVQDSSHLTLTNSSILNSFFDGVLAWYGSQATISNSVIANTDRGVNVAGNVTLTNSTVDDGRIGIWGHGGTLVMTNSIVSDSLQQGVYNVLSTQTTIQNSDVWSATGQNYLDYPDQIGINGNISSDPKFINETGGNFRLKLGSPAIDAANGPAAPVTDSIGSPRYDDPRTANTGTITSNNAYADMGAYEFVEGATSNLDLIVTSVSNLTPAEEGDQVSLNWTVKNVGTQVATGSWHDSIYLSADPIWSPDDVLLGDVLHSGNVGANQSYSATATEPIPGVLPGSYYVLVRTNSDAAVFEGANLSNNVTASVSTGAIDISSLVIGTPLTGAILQTGGSEVYQLVIPQGSDVKVSLNGPDGVVNELYIKRGDIPTQQSFDARGNIANQSDQSVTISGDSGGTYYVRVNATNAPAGETFTLSATLSSFSLDSISPVQGGNSGQVTISFTGSEFDATSQPQLVDATHHVISPLHVYYNDSNSLSATFDLTGHAIGHVDAQVVTGGVTSTLTGGFNIVAGTGGHLVTSITSPSAVRLGRSFTIEVQYANDGDADILAPVMNVTGSNSDPISFTSDFTNATNSVDLIGANPNGPAGVLSPGAHGTITLYAKATDSGSDTFQLTIAGYPVIPIDWTGIESITQPEGLTASQWHDILTTLSANIGDTWDDYARAISADTTLFPASLGSNESLQDVYQLEILKALGQLHPAVTGTVYLGDLDHPLANAKIDIGDPTTGVVRIASSLNDGTFILPLAEAGTYDFNVEGYLSTPRTIEVGSEGVSDLKIILNPAGAISGHVVTPQGAPVPGVGVFAICDDGTQYVSHTDSNGYYVIDTLTTGTYTVQSDGGDLTRAETTDVTVQAGAQTGQVNLVLATAAKVSGLVTGPGGPISNAVVTAIATDGSGYSADTDSTGHYTLDGLSGATYDIQASASGLVSVDFGNLVVASGATQTLPNIALTAGGTVNGQITLAGSDQPAAGVTLSLSNSSTSFTFSTDDSGQFSITGVPAGNYDLVSVLSEFMTVESNVSVAVGNVTTSNFVTAPLGMVTGKITNSLDGSPLAKVLVQAIASTGFAEVVLTDSNGNYELDGLDAGTYSIVLGDPGTPGIVAKSISLSANQNQAVADLSAPIVGMISGVVLGSDGQTPIEGAEVDLRSNGVSILTATTDVAGAYAFDLLSTGTYSIQASADGLAFPPISGVVVNNGTPLSGMNFLAGNQELKGIVTDQLTNQPVSGAFVKVSHSDSFGTPSVIATASTNADGTFDIGNLTPGTYSMIAQAKDSVPVSQTVSITIGDPANVTFALTAGFELQGTVRNGVLPVASATLTLYRADSPDIVAFATSDSTGHYQITGLAAATYRLFVQMPEFTSQLVQNVTIGTNQNLVDVALNTSNTTVSGTVTANIGPLGNAVISVTDAEGIVWARAQTDDLGGYSIPGLPPGSYSLSGQVQGYQISPLAMIHLDQGETIQGIDFTLTPVAITDADAPQTGNSNGNGNSIFVTIMKERDPGNSKPLDVDQVTAIDCKNPSEHELDLQTSLALLTGESNNKLEQLQAAFHVVIDQMKLFLSAQRTAIQLFDDAYHISIEDKSVSALIRKITDASNAADDFFGAYGKVYEDADFESIFNSGVKSLEDKVNEISAGLNLINAMNTTGVHQTSPPTISALQISQKLLMDGIAQLHIMQNCLSQFHEYEDLKQQYLVSVALVEYVYLKTQAACSQINGVDPVPYDPTNPDNSAILIGIITAPPAATDVPPVDPDGTVNATTTIPNRPKDPPTVAPTADKGGKATTNPKTGGDPNDFIGPSGFGPQAFIQSQLMAYQVDFENDPAIATAAVQIVTTTFTIDPDLDSSTFQFTGFGFGQNQFTVPAGLSHYETTIDLRPQGISLLVPVTLDENPITGKVTVTFQSLDPLTLQPPDGVNDGFLPIDNAAGDGQGYFTYTVQPKSGLPSGTQITEQTSIIFDINSGVDTPVALNTLDVGVPQSSVAPLSATSPANFTVSWSGTDDTNGSGIASYDIYVSDNGGAFTRWQSATTAISAIYPGQVGHTYAFYSVATDNVGHVEAIPLAADATTFVPANAAPVIADQSLTVPENSIVNTVVGTIQASDPDVGDTLTYTITSGNELGAFGINSQTGQITVANTSLLDFETHPTWPLTMQVSDNQGATDTATLTINLTNVNEAPALTAKTFSIAENSANNSTVGAELGTDPDVADTLTYSITGGNASGAFAINAQTGVITVANSSQLDFETNPTFSLTVQVMDNHDATGSATVTVNLTDVNDAPQLALNGSAVAFSAKAAKKSGPVHVAPNVIVVDPDQLPANSIGGGTLTVSIDVSAKVAKKGKVTMYDTIGGFTGSSLGTATGPSFDNNKLTLTVHLNAGTTAAAIQSFLRGITFSSKSTGLKLNHRTLTAQVTDAAGASSNVLTQTINVTK